MQQNQPDKLVSNAKEYGLKMLRERAERLVKFLHMPPGAAMAIMPPIVIAQEVVNLMNAATFYCPEQMGQVLIKDRWKSLCERQGFCVSCGVVLDEPEPRKSPFCAKCEVNIGAMGQTGN